MTLEERVALLTRTLANGRRARWIVVAVVSAAALTAQSLAEEPLAEESAQASLKVREVRARRVSALRIALVHGNGREAVPLEIEKMDAGSPRIDMFDDQGAWCGLIVRGGIELIDERRQARLTFGSRGGTAPDLTLSATALVAKEEATALTLDSTLASGGLAYDGPPRDAFLYALEVGTTRFALNDPNLGSAIVFHRADGAVPKIFIVGPNHAVERTYGGR